MSKEFKVTDEIRERVSVLAGGGMIHEEIALTLGIDLVLLRSAFTHELSVGAYERRAEVLEALYQAGKNGNVASARAYLAETPRAAAPPAPDTKAPKAEGKKAQANAAAKTAAQGTGWDDILPKHDATGRQLN